MWLLRYHVGFYRYREEKGEGGGVIPGGLRFLCDRIIPKGFTRKERGESRAPSFQGRAF